MSTVVTELSPCEIWSYFQKHKQEIEKNEYIIAENEEYGVTVWLTSEEGFPCLIVTADGYQYAEITAVSEKDCEEKAEKIYDDYLTEKFIEKSEEDEYTYLEQQDMIYEREAELDEAVILFIDIVLEKDAGLALGIDGEKLDDLYEDVKDHFLEYLARKYEFPIRRPMVLEDDESGEDFFVEYPYEHMVYEDKDNPVYKK